MAAAAAAAARVADALKDVIIQPLSLNNNNVTAWAKLVVRASQFIPNIDDFLDTMQGMLLIMQKLITAETKVLSSMPAYSACAKCNMSIVNSVSGEDYDSWNDLLLALKSALGADDENNVSIPFHILNAVQKPGEAVNIYVNRVVAKFLSLEEDHRSFLLLRAILLQNLRSEAIKVMTHAAISKGEGDDIASLTKSLKDSAAAVGLSTKPERSSNHTFNNQRPSRRGKNSQTQPRQEFGLRHDLPPGMSNEERSRRFQSNCCLKCGKPGHVVKNCRSRPDANPPGNGGPAEL